MSKDMKTAKEKLLARVAAMQKQINAAAEEDLQAWATKLDSEGTDAKLIQETDAAKAKEQETVEKSTGVDADAAAGGQNARANANWPMSANLKTARRLAALASREANTVRRMLALAGKVQADDGECEEDDEKTACVASKLIRMAVKRSRTTASMMRLARNVMKAKDDEDESDEDESDEGKPFESRDKKVAARLIAIAKSLVAEETPAETTAAAPTESVTAKDDSGKEIAAALVELAKTLAADESTPAEEKK